MEKNHILKTAVFLFVSKYLLRRAISIILKKCCTKPRDAVLELEFFESENIYKSDARGEFIIVILYTSYIYEKSNPTKCLKQPIELINKFVDLNKTFVYITLFF